MRCASPVELSVVLLPLLPWFLAGFPEMALAAPTPARPSRGDRRVPPPADGLPDDATLRGPTGHGDGLAGTRLRRTVARVATGVAAGELSPAHAVESPSGWKAGAGVPGEQRPLEAADLSLNQRNVHKTSTDEDYYYYYYFDSFVEGVTSNADFDEYSGKDAPVDLEDGEDDRDDGEIVELLKMTSKQKAT